ncbi:hypothetical protein BU15DRAFT_65293 [Melanogaster broomeanus]|nr:hypothetical protein BU15DRAFT_65293 [Melanogaster broomeanus]
MSLTGTGSSATASALLDLNVYEYAITFDEEVRRAKTIHFGTSLKRLKVAFLKESRWNTVKILYLVCRYLPFLWAATNTSPRIVSEDANVTIIICAELMFLVRAYALWDRTRLALAVILVNFMAFFIPIVVITALFNSAPTFVPVPGITSCSTASQSRILLLGYVLLVIGETVSVSMAVLRARLMPAKAFSQTSSASSVAVILMVAFLLLSDDPTCDTGYSDAPFAVEIGPESAKSG